MPPGDEAADTIVRLYHRRRGWAWVGFGSLIGLIVYLALGAALFDNLTGAAETASIIPLFILLVLAVAGLIAAIVDSVRLRRFGKAEREAAREGVAHHPVYAHAHRMPPRHFGSWIWAIFMLVTMTAVMVSLLPQEVNGAAYLVGAESQVNFHPVEYVQVCVKGGCHTATDGYLSGSGANVRWDSQVPLNETFPVRVPLWNWGTGHNVIESTGGAIGLLVAGLFFNVFAVALLFAVIALIQHRHLILHPNRQVPAGSR